MKRKSTSSKRKMKISVKRRLNLVDLVLIQGYSIVRASKKLELKPYTAASILNKFKEKGVIFDHKLKKYIKPEPSSCPLAQNLNNIEEVRQSDEDLPLQPQEVELQREEPQDEMPEVNPSQWLSWMPFLPPQQYWYIFYN